MLPATCVCSRLSNPPRDFNRNKCTPEHRPLVGIRDQKPAPAPMPAFAVLRRPAPALPGSPCRPQHRRRPRAISSKQRASTACSALRPASAGGNAPSPGTKSRGGLALTCEDPDGEDEQRFIPVGAGAVGRIVTVAYSYRDSEVRLISARRATRKERDSYARGV